MTTPQNELLKQAAKSGLWAVLACLLVYVMVWEVRPGQAEQVRQIAIVRAEHAEMRAEINTTLKEVRDAVRRSAYLEFRNCINTARTDDQRELCAYKE